jgi:hypothetical protein
MTLPEIRTVFVSVDEKPGVASRCVLCPSGTPGKASGARCAAWCLTIAAGKAGSLQTGFSLWEPDIRFSGRGSYRRARWGGRDSRACALAPALPGGRRVLPSAGGRRTAPRWPGLLHWANFQRTTALHEPLVKPFEPFAEPSRVSSNLSSLSLTSTNLSSNLFRVPKRSSSLSLTSMGL